MDKTAPLNPQPGFIAHQPPPYSSMDYDGPAPQPYVPGPSAPHVTLVTAPLLGPTSSMVQCPNCRENVQTRTILKASGKTHLIALLLCVLQCWICIPCVYCADSLQETHHHCPNCNTYVGKYSSL